MSFSEWEETFSFVVVATTPCKKIFFYKGFLLLLVGWLVFILHPKFSVWVDLEIPRGYHCPVMLHR